MSHQTIIRLPTVKQRLALSRSSIYQLVKSGKLPPPISLGTPRAVGWIESEISEFIETRIKESRKA